MSRKQFLSYTLIVGLFVCTVDLFAMFQFLILMNIPIRLKFLIIPSLVGLIFGSLFVLYRHYYLLARERSLYEKLAKYDTLTGAMSRYACELILSHENKRCERTRSPFAVLIFDIDDFKSINDRYGHATGDRVLQDLCRCVVGELREIDNICRWGGEEFIVILPETGTEAAEEIAERLRHKVGSYDFGLEEPVTISIGGTSSSEARRSSELVEKADKALYLAKNGGKNRVVIV